MPNDYACNPAVTFDQGEPSYWDPLRASKSLAYQASFYAWASHIVQRFGLESLADFGCGTAAKLAHLSSNHPTLQCCGLDQPHAIDLCRDQYNFGEWLAYDLDQPQALAPRQFDLVMASDVIEHLECPDNLLTAMRQFAHEGTWFMLSTPEREVLRGSNCRVSPNPYHVREWSRSEFACYLTQRGFEVVEHRLLPAFNVTHSLGFTRRAMRRWVRLKSIRYNQAVLARISSAG